MPVQGVGPHGNLNGRSGERRLPLEGIRIIDAFDANSLIVGRVVAAHVHQDALRAEERDDQDLIHLSPLLAYLHPGRFAAIGESRSFPFPEGMER